MDANCSRPVSTRATTAVTSGAAFLNCKWFSEVLNLWQPHTLSFSDMWHWAKSALTHNPVAYSPGQRTDRPAEIRSP